MARECAYKGANIMLRTAGYTAPIRHSWHVSNQSNSFSNLMYTANVCMAGTGVFNSMGEGMIVNFDGTPLVVANGMADEIVTGEVRPKLADEARRIWGVENNVYQFGHRGHVAVKGVRRTSPIPTCATSWRANTGCRGRTRCCIPTARAAVSRFQTAHIAASSGQPA